MLPAVKNTVIASVTAFALAFTAAAVAFNSYSRSERVAIQRQLSRQGYYYSSIDGSFGPGTYKAVAAYARDNGQGSQLASRNGAYAVYDGLIY